MDKQCTNQTSTSLLDVSGAISDIQSYILWLEADRAKTRNALREVLSYTEHLVEITEMKPPPIIKSAKAVLGRD